MVAFARIAGKSYAYGDLCLRWRDYACFANPQIALVHDLNANGRNISFPIHRPAVNETPNYLEKKLGGVYLASSLGGVWLADVNGDGKYQVGDAEHWSHFCPQVQAAQTWLMLFQLEFQPANVSAISGLWEKALQDYILHNATADFPLLDLTVFHSQTLNEELKRNADSLVPKFAVAFTLLILFCQLCGFVTVRDTW